MNNYFLFFFFLFRMCDNFLKTSKHKPCLKHSLHWFYITVHRNRPSFGATPLWVIQLKQGFTCLREPMCPCVGERCIWNCPSLSCSVQKVFFVLFGWLMRHWLSSNIATVLRTAAPEICSEYHTASLRSFH